MAGGSMYFPLPSREEQSCMRRSPCDENSLGEEDIPGTGWEDVVD